ncbi:hypothetical protein ABT364_04705 [Massilia sp. SR12]
MGVRFNHTIVMSGDTHQAAVLLATILGLSDPSQLGSMLLVEGPSRHAVFLLSEDEFDLVLAHIDAASLAYWSGPDRQTAGRICRNVSGRGLCMEAADGHLMQIMTAPNACGDVPFSA